VFSLRKFQGPTLSPARAVRGAILAAILLGASAVGFGQAEEAAAFTPTLPSADRQLSFVRPGRIAEIGVHEGDVVKVGDLLARLDDGPEVLELESLKAQAEDDTRVRAAAAQWDQKKADLKRFEWAAEKGAATQFELEHARLEVTIADLALELARFTQGQDGRKYEEAKARVEQMRLRSPVAGRVERIVKNVGEAVTAQDVVVRVVCTDPLWVDAPVPVALAGTLKVGDRAEVTFADGAARVAEGAVEFIAAVADAASATRTVRVAVPNPDGRPAGERVRVRFPAAALAPAAPPPPATSSGASAPSHS